MKKREFNKILKDCSLNGVLSTEKVDSLPNDIKDKMVLFIVRNRGPILINFISENMDKNWLSCCGYFYITKSKENDFVFLHTSEQIIK